MTALEREYLTLWIADDLSALLREEPAQLEAFAALTDELERACALWLTHKALPEVYGPSPPLGQAWDSFFLCGPDVSDDFLPERASQHQPEA